VGRHLILVGKQLPPRGFDLSSFDHVHLGAKQNHIHGFRCVLQRLSVCGAIPENKASGMGKFAPEGTVEMWRCAGGTAGLYLLSRAHPAKEHEDAGDELDRVTVIRIQMHENTAGYEKCTILEIKPRTNSTRKRAPRKSLPCS
jgi:hypothetical protein